MVLKCRNDKINPNQTTAQIGERVGWSESVVKQHSVLNTKIVTQVLDFAQKHQIGRVTEKDTNVTCNFTEGWQFGTMKSTRL
jgi:hypothetical protein